MTEVTDLEKSKEIRFAAPPVMVERIDAACALTGENRSEFLRRAANNMLGSQVVSVPIGSKVPSIADTYSPFVPERPFCKRTSND